VRAALVAGTPQAVSALVDLGSGGRAYDFRIERANAGAIAVGLLAPPP
jgi:hypothetical protein